MITIEDIKKEFGGLEKEELYQKILEERTRSELSKTNFDKVVDQLRESNKRHEYDRLQDSIIGDLMSDMISRALQKVDWDELVGQAIQKHLQVDVSDTKDGIETEVSWN